VEIEQEYWDKSGDSVVIPNNFTRNEHGFASYQIIEEGELILVVGNVYGDGEYWSNHLNRVAVENGCRKMRFATRRNPDAWCRKFGFDCVGWILEKEVSYG
jgi:hypothetical protein